MNRCRTLRDTATVAATGCVLAALAAPVAAHGAAAPAHRAPGATLTLRTAAHHVMGHRSGKRTFVELGTFLVAGDVPFEVRTTRAPSYRTAPVAHLVVGVPDTPQNGEHDDIALDPSMVTEFDGLADFLHLRVRDADGRLVVNRTRNYCASGQGVRFLPDAPDTSPYPSDFGCYHNPFTLGAVLGIQAGWAAPGFSEYGTRLPLPLGRFDVTVSVDKAYRDLLGMTDATAVRTMKLRVVKGNGCGVAVPGVGRGCRTGPVGGHRGVAPRPAAHEPGADVAPPSGTPLPDLRALPSAGIRVQKGHWLAFGATVWNAGPSTLVVDGFRRPGQPVMDSYEYFYDTDGNPVGHAAVGTMEWDPRAGHRHWHFEDFARYSLLDSDRSLIVRSKKQGFCLAATDAVDYTVPGANWNPYNTDLTTACGDRGALGVREVLDVGSGDTYTQYRPGQSFNLDGLDDGIYFIKVEANPDGKLYEADTTNNVSLRRVRIGTVGHGADAGDRTVKVFDVGLIHTH